MEMLLLRNNSTCLKNLASVDITWEVPRHINRLSLQLRASNNLDPSHAAQNASKSTFGTYLL